MEKIASFTINHIKLQPGIYVSRRDTVGSEALTTFDLRMTSPNEEPVMNTAEVHTIEHLGATFLRNHKEYKSKTVYFGPMGCRTGFYLILAGQLESKDIVPLIKEMYEFIRDFEGEVPGASPMDCGNYLDMNLPMAKYLAKKYLFRNKKTFGITSLSLWLGCELALCSAVIVNGVDLQNYYSKEPDFQIGITEEACNYLIESSPDTKNMKFFPKSLMNDIETTIGNELHSVENIKGFYPIVGKNGKENIKILIDGDKISTVIQTVSIGEQEELKDFIQKNDKLVNWEQFQNNHGTIVLHDHRMSDYIAGEVQDYIGTEMEFYDLVPVGTEMSSLVPEKLVNCGYLDITEDDFPEMKLCWDGKNINILLVTETTYDWLVEKLTPQIFEIQFNVDKNQESVIRERLNQMIRNYNMEFQSKYRHADKLNLFYLDSKSERLLKEQNYIQTSRWLLMSISGILIFIGIMNFANTRISDIMLRQWECKILERVGMTKKQEYRMFVTEGLFYWLLLCGLLMSFGNLGIGIMQWYMKMQISYFAFRYPVKEMIALMVFLLLFSIIFPGIIYKKLKKKRK